MFNIVIKGLIAIKTGQWFCRWRHGGVFQNSLSHSVNVISLEQLLLRSSSLQQQTNCMTRGNVLFHSRWALWSHQLTCSNSVFILLPVCCLLSWTGMCYVSQSVFLSQYLLSSPVVGVAESTKMMCSCQVEENKMFRIPKIGSSRLQQAVHLGNQ